MEPIKSYIERAWESLTEGWRELLARSTGALTHFRAGEIGREREGFPRWSLLAGETWETALSVVIRVEIPGVSKDDLAVDILGSVLRIRGEKRSGEEGHGTPHYHLMERAYGHFERHVPLPHGVDAEKAEVSYRDGVLTVILPKTEPVPPRQLPVD